MSSRSQIFVSRQTAAVKSVGATPPPPKVFPSPPPCGGRDLSGTEWTEDSWGCFNFLLKIIIKWVCTHTRSG
uniref:Uncharacterized protein n=1 Tax=Anguilla anguilla TaxID=7936 RepID=A0A0E9PEX3_ANGAN